MSEATQAVTVHEGGAAVEVFKAGELATDFSSPTFMQTLAIDVIDRWVYSFKGSDGATVTDLSIKGVQAIAREMAKQGEIIRPTGIEVVYEDEDEIRFMAHAARYIVKVIDGKPVYIELDTCTRSKRVNKKMEVGIWEGQWPNRVKVGTVIKKDEFYYEKGVSKAYRNAMAPLLGDEVRAAIVDRWRQVQPLLGHNKAVLPAARPADRQLAAPAAPAKQPAQPQQRQQRQTQARPAAAKQQQAGPAIPEAGVSKNLIQAKMKDIESSWDAVALQQLGMEILQRWPKAKPVGQGKTLNLAALDAKEAHELRMFIDRKMGGGPPPEQEEEPENPDDGDDTGSFEGPAAGESEEDRAARLAELQQCEHPSSALTDNGDGTYNCGACGTTLGTSAGEE